MNTRSLFGRAALCIVAFSSVASLCLHANANAANASGSETAPRPIVKVISKDGKITYTDRSVPANAGIHVQALRGGVGNRVLAASPQPAASAASAADAKVKATPANPNDIVSWAQQQDARMKEQSKQVEAANAAIREANCGNAKQNLAMYERGRVRTGELNAAGQMTYLNDDQLMGKKAEAQSQIAEFCK